MFSVSIGWWVLGGAFVLFGGYVAVSHWRGRRQPRNYGTAGENTTKLGLSGR